MPQRPTIHIAARRLGLVLLATLPLLGAGSAAAQSVLRIGLAEEPDILDPTLARTYVGRIVFASVCDKLFDIDGQLAIVPQLALGHETSDDGRAVTIRLRPGVTFHDGEPLDAEAARFSLERHLTTPGSFRKQELSAVERIVVVDPLTIRLELRVPFSPLLAQLTDRAGMMVSPKAARAAGEAFGMKPVCAGPYRLVKRVPQDRIVVERFPGYWRAADVHIERIVYRAMSDATVRLANLKAGDLDLIERPLATDIPQIKNDPRLKLASVIELGYNGITINEANGERAKTPLGRDARVRRALDLAIDRDALNNVVFDGEFVPGNQWVSPRNPYYQASHPVPKRDLAEARALLKAAGISPPLKVELMVPNGSEPRLVAELLQSMVADAGIELNVRVTELASALQLAESGNFEAFLLAWSGRVDPDGNIYPFLACNGPQNIGRVCDPGSVALLDLARTTRDPIERKSIYGRAADRLLPDAHILYLYHRRLFIAHAARLEGYRQLPDGLVRVIGLTLGQGR